MKKKSEKNFGVFFICTILLVLARSLIGSEISMWDEMQYCVNALQIIKESKLFVDDWNVTQLSGIISFPFVAIFSRITGDTQGVILFLRLVYLAIKILIVLWAKHRLDETAKISKASIFGCLLYLAYSPYNISTISYNTVALSCAFCLTLIFATTNGKRIDWILSGILTGILVIAHPFCLIIFIPIYAEIIMESDCSKDRVMNCCVYTLSSFAIWGWALVVIFHNNSIEDVLKNIPYILGASDHDMIQKGGLYTFILKCVYYVNAVLREQVWVTVFGICMVIVTVFMKERGIYIVLTCTTIVSLVILLTDNLNFKQNAIFWPCIWLAFSYIIMYPSKKNLISFAMINATCMGVYIGSNTGMLTVSGFFVLFLIAICFSDWNKNVTNALVLKGQKVILVLTVIAIGIYSMAIEWQALIDFRNLKMVDGGPLKYMMMDSKSAETCSKEMDDLKRVNIDKNTKILCATYYPMAYVYYNCKMGGTFYFVDMGRVEEWLNNCEDNDFSYIIFRKQPAYSKDRLLFDEQIEKMVNSFCNEWSLKETDTAYYVEMIG